MANRQAKNEKGLRKTRQTCVRKDSSNAELNGLCLENGDKEWGGGIRRPYFGRGFMGGKGGELRVGKRRRKEGEEMGGCGGSRLKRSVRTCEMPACRAPAMPFTLWHVLDTSAKV